MDSERLENYVQICAHAKDLCQGVVLWEIWLIIHFNNFPLQIVKLAALRRLGFSLFHSVKVDDEKKKNFWKSYA